MKPKLLSLGAVVALLLAYTPAQATPGNHFMCYQAKQATKLCWGTAGPPAVCSVTDKFAGTCYGGANDGVACLDPTDCDTLVCQTDDCPGGESPCYFGFPTGVTKNLADGFIGQPTQDYTVKKPTEICAPASKNNEDPGADADPEHLMAFQIGIVKGGVKATKTNILVGDQFLNNQAVQIIKENRLLVPASKALSGPAGAFPTNLDHYKCYRAKGLKKVCIGGPDPFKKCKDDSECSPGGFCSPGFAKLTVKDGAQVEVDDQFQANRDYDVIKLKQVCFPVDKNGEGINDPNLYYTCYLAKPSKTSPVPQDKFGGVPGVRVNNQLGNQLIDVARERELCLPAVKDPVVVTTTTSTGPGTTTTTAVVTTTTTDASTTTTSTTTSTTGPPTTIATPCGMTPYPVCNGSCMDMSHVCVPVKGDGSLTTCFCQAGECIPGGQPACIGECPTGLACEVQEGSPFDCTGNCIPE
jgi:hypothetical protein